MRREKKVFVMLLIVLTLVLIPMQQATDDVNPSMRVTVIYPEKEKILDSQLCDKESSVKLVNLNSQIYEYYQGQFKPHTEHEFGEWEDLNDEYHVKYCACIEERIIGRHEYTSKRVGKNVIFTCEECGVTREIYIP